VRRFVPQISPFGLIGVHDASSHPKQVREAALKLESKGLISVVLLPMPRGLVLAQKREGSSAVFAKKNNRSAELSRCRLE
jgi:hypothetical protein